MPQTYFSDISQIGKIRLNGSSAESFIQTMTTVDAAAVATPGQMAPALLLNTGAEIIDLIMIARTGDAEFMLTTHPDTVAEVYEWLAAHSQLADDQGPVFANLELSNQTAKLATLAIYGPEATAILDELANSSVKASLSNARLAVIEIGQLPVLLTHWPFFAEKNERTGNVLFVDAPGAADAALPSSCKTRAESALGQSSKPLNNMTPAAPGASASNTVSIPMCPASHYEIHLPAAASKDLQDLLLGFAEIDPEDFDSYRQRRIAAQTWFTGSEQAAYLTPNTPGLLALIRPSRDFVGARALGQLRN